jgi:hypothetical protein
MNIDYLMNKFNYKLEKPLYFLNFPTSHYLSYNKFFNLSMISADMDHINSFLEAFVEIAFRKLILWSQRTPVFRIYQIF